MKHRYCVVATLLVALPLSSCILDREHDLQLTFLSSETGQPIAGVTVVVHNDDGTSFDPDNVKTSEADGKVAFRQLDKGTATISIVHEVNTGETDVFTYVGFPADTTTLGLSTHSDREDVCNRSVEVSVSGVPAATERLSVEPFFNIFGPGHGHGSSNPPYADIVTGTTEVCPEHVQDGGTISLLATARDENTNILRYGYVTDRNISDGAAYSIALEHTPSSVGWSTGSGIPLGYLAIEGLRRNVLYSEATAGSGAASAGTSGTLALPRRFPFEQHFVIAGAEDGNVDRLLFTAVSDADIDNGISVQLDTALKINQFAYDAQTRKFTWSVESDAHDAIELDFDAYISGPGELPYAGRDVYWHVLLPPATSSWTIPELPITATVQHEFAVSYLWGNLSITDYAAMTDYVELMRAQATPPATIAELYQQLGTIKRASMWLDDDGAARTLRRGVAPVPPGVAQRRAIRR